MPNAKHQTPNTKRQTPNTKHQTPKLTLGGEIGLKKHVCHGFGRCHLTELKLSGAVGLVGTQFDQMFTPAVLQQLGPTLSKFEARKCGFTGGIPVELWRHLKKLGILYLSSNELTGQALPDAFEDFGCYKTLRIMTLGDNRVGGTLPPWLGK
jgi:hypothetical protein